MSLLGSLLAYVGHFGVTLGSLWGHFGVTLGPLRAYRRRFARLMHIISPCVRSKRVQKQKVFIFAKDFACQRSPEEKQKTNDRPSRTVWEGVIGLEVLGGLEGLVIRWCIYTPGGQRPRRIVQSP